MNNISKICMVCGQKNPDDSAYCSKCDRNIDQDYGSFKKKYYGKKPKSNTKSISSGNRLGYFKGCKHFINNKKFDLEITSNSLIVHNKGKFWRKSSRNVIVYSRAKMNNLKVGKTSFQLRFTYDGKHKVLDFNKEYVDEIRRLLLKKRVKNKIDTISNKDVVPDHLTSSGDMNDDDEVIQQMRKVPNYLTSKWDMKDYAEPMRKVPNHLTSKWDLIDRDEAIQKMKNSSNYFVIEVLVIEETLQKIKNNSTKRVGATLLGGFLLGPVGALAGYAATGTNVVQPATVKNTVKHRIGFDVSVHEKGIKMIKMDDRSSIFKIPWDKIIAVFHDNETITIKSQTQDKLTFTGDVTALKGLYLISKKSMIGLIEKDEGWN